jgi:glutamate synthase (NADPH/NADH) small chain
MDPREILRLEDLCIQDHAPWCEAVCPLHVDARGMLEALARGDFQAAARIYSKKAPFPGILSRICDQPCRAACKRGEAGEAISIGLLERSCADYCGFAPEAVLNGPPKSHRVAVVGGGPSGLTAALELAKRHHEVALFEASDRLGGGLRLFPPYVLPPDILDDEIGRLAKVGVDTRTGMHVGRDTTITELLGQFDAVYLGIGRAAPVADARGLDPVLSRAVGGPIDPLTFATCEQRVFVGGSLRREQPEREGAVACSPARSMADGRRAAISIDRFLKEESLLSQRENEGPYTTRLYTSLEGIEPNEAVRPAGPGLGYARDEAIAEAQRCLQCECLECVKACTYLDHFDEYPGKCIRKVVKNINSLPGKSYRTHTKFINACSLCGLCGVVCPTDLSMEVVNREARQIMWDKGFMPPAVHDFALREMESSNAEANALARNQPGRASSAYLFFPGCQLTASAPDHVERTYAYLTGKLSGGVGLMLACCGAPAAWAGRRELFQDVVGAFVRRWKQMGRPRVILACPTCSLMFKESLADVPAVSLWEVLDAEGMPAGSPQGHGETLALHDSCTARSAPEIQDSVRRIAQKLGYQIEELPYSRGRTKCCGYGGLVYQVNQELTTKIIASRIGESPTDYLTYCTNCRDFFAGKGKSTYHVLDLIFDGRKNGTPARTGPTLSERRKNRRELVEKMLTELWGEPMSEPEGHARLSVRVAPDVAAKIEKDFILVDDVKAVIHQAEKTGNRIALGSTGRFIAHFRPSIVTYWVEYARDGDEYEVFNAYSHRMQIVKDAEQ